MQKTLLVVQLLHLIFRQLWPHLHTHFGRDEERSRRTEMRTAHQSQESRLLWMHGKEIEMSKIQRQRQVFTLSEKGTNLNFKNVCLFSRAYVSR